MSQTFLCEILHISRQLQHFKDSRWWHASPIRSLTTFLYVLPGSFACCSWEPTSAPRRSVSCALPFSAPPSARSKHTHNICHDTSQLHSNKVVRTGSISGAHPCTCTAQYTGALRNRIKLAPTFRGLFFGSWRCRIVHGQG